MGPLSILGLIGGGAGSGLQALGSIGAGHVKEDKADYNADLLRQRARLTKQASRQETIRAHEQGRKLKASQMAGFAKSGAMVTSGTPLMVMAEQAADMEKDVLQQRRNRLFEAQQYRQQAKMLEAQGDSAKIAGYIGAGSSLLKSGGTAAMLGGGMLGGGGGKAPAGGAAIKGMNIDYGMFNPQMNTINNYTTPRQFKYSAPIPKYGPRR